MTDMETLEQVVDMIARSAFPVSYAALPEAAKAHVRDILTALARTHALVPREASEDVLIAGYDANDGVDAPSHDGLAMLRRSYPAMLSASDLLASLREGG